KGWNEDDAKAALRAEIVLEPSGEVAEYALDMWWEELQAKQEEYNNLEDPYEKANIFDDHTEDYSDDNSHEDVFYEEDDLLDEYLPDGIFEDDSLSAESDKILDEILRDTDDTYDSSFVTEELLNGATGIISQNGEYYEPKHNRILRRTVPHNPVLEEAERLLEDEEPEMEFVSADEKTPDPTFVDSRISQEGIQTTPPEPVEEFSDFDFPHGFEDTFGDVVAQPDPYKNIPGMKKYESFGDMPDEEPTMDNEVDKAIQAILAEQERQLASFVPALADEEKQLEEALADASDESLFTDELQADVDGLADEIAAEISGEATELSPEEQAWYRDVDGQVAFDFKGDAQEDAFSEDELDALLDEAMDGEQLKELFDDDNLFSETGLIGRKWSPLKVKPGQKKATKKISFLEVEPFDEEAPEEDKVFFGETPRSEEMAEEEPAPEEAAAENQVKGLSEGTGLQDYINLHVISSEEEELFEEEELSDMDLPDEIETDEEDYESVEEETDEPEEFDEEDEDFTEEEPVEEVIEETADEDLDAALEELGGSLEDELDDAFEEDAFEEDAFAEDELEAILAEEIAAAPAEEISVEAIMDEIAEEDVFEKEDSIEDIPFEEVELGEIAAVAEKSVAEEPVIEETIETTEEDLFAEEDVFAEDELEAILAEEPSEEAAEETVEEVPEEESVEETTEEIPVKESVEETTEEIPVKESAEEITEEIPAEESVEETTEEIPEEEKIEEELPAGEAPAEEITETTEGEAPVEDAPIEVITEEPKKGLKKRFRAFDLAKKIGLTIGDDTEEVAAGAAGAAGVAAAVVAGEALEQPAEAATGNAEAKPEVQTVVIGTDETWGYYASDIETNRLDGFEIFDR
ncbi:MAG: hypothetical protein IK109_11030, partial [Clostridiales bacterium]|nr:hypothetical protein [Clostridiales bacterium]